MPRMSEEECLAFVTAAPRTAKRHWATRIGGRYMGADRAEEYGARNGVPGEILIRIRPTRIAGETGVAD